MENIAFNKVIAEGKVRTVLVSDDGKFIKLRASDGVSAFDECGTVTRGRIFATVSGIITNCGQFGRHRPGLRFNLRIWYNFTCSFG